MFDLVTASAILFPINSPVLWNTFLEAVFKESGPVFNNYFVCFLANDKNPYPLTYFLGSTEYCRSKSVSFLFINKQCQIRFIFYF